jgi:hypothetical protein
MMGITGGIGVDDPAAAAGKIRLDSLVESYRTLRPGQTVPAALVKLNERFTRQFQAAGNQRPAPTPPPQLKNQGFFNNNICKTFNMGWWAAYPKSCLYNPRTTVECVTVATGDITFAYADNDSDNVVFKNDMNFQLVRAHTWGWYTWPYGTGYVCIRTDEDLMRAGAVGLTDHGTYIK